MDFYYPEQIKIKKQSYPIFCFSESLCKMYPDCEWTIIDKPPVLMDCHVAEIYGKTTGNLNLQVERNKEYFQTGWRFKPTLQEWRILKSLISKYLQEAIALCNSPTQILAKQMFRETPPWFYTKEGVDMAAFFQKTPIAKQHAIFIVESFNEFQSSRNDFSIREELESVHYMIKALVNEIHRLSEKYQRLEERIEKNGLQTSQRLLSPKASVPHTGAYISSYQAQKLKSIVAKISPNRKQRMKVWAQFKSEFGLSRYSHLPQGKFEEALRWLESRLAIKY